jgi:hypothetical protein
MPLDLPLREIMSDTLAEWAAVLLFIFLFIGLVVLEVRWLVRKGWAASPQAWGFVLVTDLLGLVINSLVVVVAFFLLFMLVMGPAGTGSDVQESAYVTILALAMILPFLLLILSKRFFLSAFNIRSGKPAWIYSLVASISILVITQLPPSLIYYLIGYARLWK